METGAIRNRNKNGGFFIGYEALDKSEVLCKRNLFDGGELVLGTPFLILVHQLVDRHIVRKDFEYIIQIVE